jgi:hypothetical protein
VPCLLACLLGQDCCVGDRADWDCSWTTMITRLRKLPVEKTTLESVVPPLDDDNNSTSLLTNGGHVEERDGVTRW